MIGRLKKLYVRCLNKIIYHQRSKYVTIVGRDIFFHRKSTISLLGGAKKKNIKIDSNSYIYGNLSVCRDGKISIGKFSQVGANSTIRSLCSVWIGSYTAIADNVVICDNNNHPVNPNDRIIMQKSKPGSFQRSWVNSDNAPIIIGDACWIGQFSRICKGVTIGNGSIVAANSVVTKDVPSNCIVAGNPAKVVRTDIDKNKRFFQY